MRFESSTNLPQHQFTFNLENFVDCYRHWQQSLIADVSFNL